MVTDFKDKWPILADRGIHAAIIAFLFLNPFPHVTALKEISFYSAIVLFLLTVFRKDRPLCFRTPLSIPFALFTAWSLLTLLFALNIPNSIHDYFVHLIKYLALYFIMINVFRTREDFIVLVWTIVVSTSIHSTWILNHYYIVLGNPLTNKLGMHGLFMEEIPSNIVGILALTASFFCFFLIKHESNVYRRFFIILLLCPIMVATIAAQARATLLGILIAGFVMFCFNTRQRRASLVFFLAFILLIGILPTRNLLTPKAIQHKWQSDDRVKAWMLYIEMIRDYPISGIGFGMQTYNNDNLLNSYNIQMPEKYRQQKPLAAPHNILIDVAVRTGVAGLFLYLYILSSFLQMVLKLLRKGNGPFTFHWSMGLLVTFTAIFVVGLFENVASGPPAVIFYTIMGMTSILWNMRNSVSDAIYS